MIELLVWVNLVFNCLFTAFLCLVFIRVLNNSSKEMKEKRQQKKEIDKKSIQEKQDYRRKEC